MKNIRIFIWKLSIFWWWKFQYIWIGMFSKCQFVHDAHNLYMVRTFCTWCAMHEMGQYSIWGQSRPRSECAFVHSDLNIVCSSTYTTVSIDSVSRQWRPWSGCAGPELSVNCSFCGFNISYLMFVLKRHKRQAFALSIPYFEAPRGKKYVTVL